MVQFIDNQLKPVPSSGDIVPLRDIASNTDKRTTFGGVAEAMKIINRPVHGTARFATPTTGFVSSGTQLIPYDQLSPQSFGVTLISAGSLKVDSDGIYLITANVTSIDAAAPTVHRVQYSMDNGATFKESVWTARASPDTNTRQFPTKTFQRFFPAGTIFRHLIDSTNQRLGGTTDDPEATSLTVTKIA